ncbi:inner (transmembrane) protein (plasmid) [Legionella adelaidensis]|uniref:Inner (Transmembrane) protein n=1 Tax=Legionella adelaidensis TaxID=45056 RepID=A0A0W0R252_9GAMM|nr:disulfide bond formation protein B [Legionella adelaidensis]KTC65070.1 transmembrane protein [Legionella adelaidensis]VEH85411.1 inner (transmembrane) protein [Legionella adelaidensis]
MKKINVIGLENGLNALAVLGLFFLLALSLFIQFYFSELPCPLCLLQRVGFVIISVGFLLNLRYGFRPSHYAIALLGALYTSFVALRQIALHVVPGTGSYGSSILGFHLYTWSFILSMLIVVAATIMLGVDRQYKETAQEILKIRFWANILFALMLLVTVVNFVYTLKECGIKECPENPSAYIW